MKTYEELIKKTEQVRTNELPESNTHDLIGEIFTGIVELQKQTSKENDNTFKEKVDKNNITGDFGSSVDKIIHQKVFTEQTKGRVLGIVDIADIDTLNNLDSLGHYHVYRGKRPIHELIVSSDNMSHTIIQFMFSNFSGNVGNLSTHQDNIATIVYRIYNLNRADMTDIPRGTWGAWRQYGQNFEVLSETEYENLKRKDSEMFYYTFKEEEEA